MYLALVGLSFISLIIASTTSLVISRSFYKEEAKNYSEKIVTLISLNLDDLLDTIEDTWVSVVSNIDVIDYFKHEHQLNDVERFYKWRYISRQYTENILSINRRISSIILYPIDGVPISYGEVKAPFLEGYRNFNVFTKTIENNEGLLWYGPHDFEESYNDIVIQDIFSLTGSVRTLDQPEKLGVVEVQTKKATIENIFKKINVIDNSIVTLQDRHGNILIAVSTPEDCIESLYQAVSEHGSNLDDNLDTLLKSQRTLSNGWQVIHYQPMENLITSSLKVGKFILLIGLAIMIGAVCFAFAVTEILVKPLRRIVRITENIQDGPADIAEGFQNVGEIGILYKNIAALFKRMRETEIDMLMAQISPHFFYNTLNSIRCRAEVDGNKQVSEMMEAFIGLVEISINNKIQFISIKEELLIVDRYIQLQSIRMGKHIEVLQAVPPYIEKLMIPKLVIQPIVENSILHGFENNNERHIISLEALKNNGNVRIWISDNGIGFSTSEDIAEKKRFNKIGLSNINERIRLLFGSEYGISIHSNPGEGTIVCITLPCLSTSQIEQVSQDAMESS